MTDGWNHKRWFVVILRNRVPRTKVRICLVKIKEPDLTLGLKKYSHAVSSEKEDLKLENRTV